MLDFLLYSSVAGTIAAIDNGYGVVGVAAGATVVPVRVLGAEGRGTLSGILAGIEHVAAYGRAGDVANLSLGGPFTQLVNDAVIAAAASGIKFTLAAGNFAWDARFFSPGSANGPNVYTISASDQNNNLAYFSNFGAGTIDYACPGVGIWSTWIDGGYKRYTGTSMAAPHAAGMLLLESTGEFTVGNLGYVGNDPDGEPDPIMSIQKAS
jgi:subtilisin family serine protease